MSNLQRELPGQIVAIVFMLVWLPLFGALMFVLFMVKWISVHLDDPKVRLLYAGLLPALFLAVCALIGVALPLETLVLLPVAVLALYFFLGAVAWLTNPSTYFKSGE